MVATVELVAGNGPEAIPPHAYTPVYPRALCIQYRVNVTSTQAVFHILSSRERVSSDHSWHNFLSGFHPRSLPGGQGTPILPQGISFSPPSSCASSVVAKKEKNVKKKKEKDKLEAFHLHHQVLGNIALCKYPISRFWKGLKTNGCGNSNEEGVLEGAGT